ncbi:MAG: beta-galactosidase [Acidobacteria bacterium]|nr:beta-galactosidase [Acidobacteriota bacterium]
MRLITGIDTAMPDIRNSWSDHAEWNQHNRFWEEDFRQLAGLGFDLLRWQMPWSMVEPRPGEYRWELIDPKVELANRLGIELLYPIVHFNYPQWVGEGTLHSVVSQRLPERLAEYTERLLTRYRFALVIPIVEVQMDAWQRGRVGNWQPHFKANTAYRAITANLVRAFQSSARVARAHGAMVLCSEPAPAIDVVRQLRDSIDVAGIDLYPLVHRRRTLIGWLRHWWREIGRPLCLSEFGTPESYNPGTHRDVPGFTAAGVDQHRVQQAREMREALDKVRIEGIPIPCGGWYPGTGNIGWGYALTRDRSAFDCDRAGLVDLARQPDGTLKRVLCAGLTREVLGLATPGAFPAAAPAARDVRLPLIAPAGA